MPLIIYHSVCCFISLFGAVQSLYHHSGSPYRTCKPFIRKLRWVFKLLLRWEKNFSPLFSSRLLNAMLELNVQLSWPFFCRWLMGLFLSSCCDESADNHRWSPQISHPVDWDNNGSFVRVLGKVRKINYGLWAWIRTSTVPDSDGVICLLWTHCEEESTPLILHVL